MLLLDIDKYHYNKGSILAITTLKKHDKCPVKAIRLYEGPHFGKLICSKHKKHIQWLSEADFKTLADLDPKLVELNGVKERPVRQKPKKREIVFQRQVGNCWNNAYSFEM